MVATSSCPDKTRLSLANLRSGLGDYCVKAQLSSDHTVNELFLIDHCDSPTTVESLDYSDFLSFVVGSKLIFLIRDRASIR